MEKISLTTLADNLLEWLREEEHIVLDEFFVQYGLTMKQAEAYAKKNKKFRDTLDFARDTIYARLIAGALTKRFNHSFVTYLLKTKAQPKEEEFPERKLSDEVLKERLITLAQAILNDFNQQNNERNEANG